MDSDRLLELFDEAGAYDGVVEIHAEHQGIE